MNSVSYNMMDTNVASLSPGKLAECRICHEEDEDSNMETPCSCRGSLKYSHRACVQRWCNEKGDTTCEICRQQFKPGYTSPPPLLNHGGIPLNLRGDWELSRSDLNNNHLIPTISADENFMDPNFIWGDWELSRSDLNNNHLIPTISADENFMDPNFDEYPMLTSGSLMCCRVVTVIFVVLLVLRHTLPFVMYIPGEYSVSWLMLVTLQTVGILLPIYIMVKAFVAIQRRNQQGLPISPSFSSDEAGELRQHRQQSHLIHLP